MEGNAKAARETDGHRISPNPVFPHIRVQYSLHFISHLNVCLPQALFHETQGSYGAAEKLLVEALRTMLVQRGTGAVKKDNPDVARCLANLGGIYKKLERYEDAELMLTEAIATMGKNHPDTARSWCSLAAMYTTTKRYTEAERSYANALKILRQAMPGDPVVARTLVNLALM